MENKVNPLLVIVSVLIPLVGYILYFTKRKDEGEVANSYLWAAIGGSVVGVYVTCL